MIIRIIKFNNYNLFKITNIIFITKQISLHYSLNFHPLHATRAA